MDSVMYQPKNYGPAIYLALNHAAGNIEIFDYFYDEDYDLWFVEVNEHGIYVAGFQLEGSYVRACYNTLRKKGEMSWLQI